MRENVLSFSFLCNILNDYHELKNSKKISLRKEKEVIEIITIVLMQMKTYRFVINKECNDAP
jgi:hypothetical protein